MKNKLDMLIFCHGIEDLKKILLICQSIMSGQETTSNLEICQLIVEMFSKQELNFEAIQQICNRIQNHIEHMTCYVYMDKNLSDIVEIKSYVTHLCQDLKIATQDIVFKQHDNPFTISIRAKGHLINLGLESMLSFVIDQNVNIAIDKLNNCFNKL